jgi:hypothetical protein
MRCLSAVETEAIFSSPKFRVCLDHQWYRSALVLDPAVAYQQTRIAAAQPTDIRGMAHFVGTLNRWLPSNRARLLWVDHWELGVYGFDNVLVGAAWRGLGETRPLGEACGLFLEAQDWDQEDQAEVSPVQAEARGLLAGMVAMLMMTQSDGWLVAEDCADRIEFWEGNFLFYSADAGQIERANEIVETFGCVRWRE